MAKTLRTSGDYTVKAGDGYNAGSGSNTITLDSALVSVSGNLTVAGTTTTVNTTNTVVADNIIELNSGISSSSNDAGIIIERGSTGNNAAIIWDESADKFILGTTTATGADKSGGITVTAGALEVGTLTTGNLTALSLTTNDITSNGSNAAITVSSSGTGDVKIDAGGDIVLDADGADIKLEDAGTEFGRISRITSDLVIKSMGDNQDIILKGLDDSATINALTLDMSAAGAAIFNSTVTATDITANSLTTNVISSNGSNADISIQPSGTGDVILSALRVNGTTLDSSDSTKVTIAEAVDITGATDIGGALTGTSASFSTTLAVTGTSTFSDGVTAESIITNSVTSNGSNADISIQPSGTGNLTLGAVKINGTTLSSDDSTKITIDEAVDVTGTLFSRGNVFGVQTLTGSGSTGVISLTDTVTLLVTTGGSQAFSLADGVEGQIKIISMKTDGGSGIVTPANFVNGTRITFDDVEDTVTLLYQSTGWVALARQNAVFS